MSLKEKIMNQMMDKQFGNMSGEEKQQMMETMMEKFFSGMSDDDKKDMMKNMMPKMMEGMMGGMNGNPMMGMMGMMMGKKKEMNEKGEDKMPWDRCMEMISSFKETASSAKFATPELRGLFEEWCSQIENEFLDFIKQTQTIDIIKICKKFKLSEESVKYLLSKMAAKGLIEYKV